MTVSPVCSDDGSVSPELLELFFQQSEQHTCIYFELSSARGLAKRRIVVVQSHTLAPGASSGEQPVSQTHQPPAGSSSTNVNNTILGIHTPVSQAAAQVSRSVAPNSVHHLEPAHHGRPPAAREACLTVDQGESNKFECVPAPARADMATYDIPVPARMLCLLLFPSQYSLAADLHPFSK